jgi:hypothetical protein
MDWFLFAVVLPVTLLFVALVACSIHWASTHGQAAELRRMARSWLGRPSTEQSPPLPGPGPDASHQT